MHMEKFLCHRRGAALDLDERAALEKAIIRVVTVDARKTIVPAGKPLAQSTLLIEGLMCRFIDNRHGLRQLVAFHVPGDFVDLHAYPLKSLDHDVATMTAAKVAIVPHSALDAIVDERPQLARKLWFSTLLDAAIHRAWLFRIGRLDAGGRVAHFLCETNARLHAVGLSDGTTFKLNITQSDLADICGLTNVHINRVLRSLREENIMRFRGRQVEILDLARLQLRGEFDPEYLYIEPDALPHTFPASVPPSTDIA